MVEISFEQMGRMCGNILELEDGRGLPILGMSTQVGLVAVLLFVVLKAAPSLLVLPRP